MKQLIELRPLNKRHKMGRLEKQFLSKEYLIKLSGLMYE